MIHFISLLFACWIIYLIIKLFDRPKTMHLNQLIYSEQQRLKLNKAKDGVHSVFLKSKLDGTPDLRCRAVRIKVIGLNETYK